MFAEPWDQEPPSPEHRSIMVQYETEKDQNQIRNLAMMVADPTGVRLPKGQNKGRYFAFVEMETQEQAKELLMQVATSSDEYKVGCP